MQEYKNLSIEEKRELKDLLLLKDIARCENNTQYFINNYLYTFNPKEEPYHYRFELFPFQHNLVNDIKKAIESGDDVFVEKCREMGATYTLLAVFLWYWRFVPGSNFLIGSRKEDYVDNRRGGTGEISNKEESLFGKLEYFLKRLPAPMLPKKFNIDKHMNYMSLVNPENGNVIGGESSNPNFSRGGRQKAILLDEFAFWDSASAVWGATADTTNCRIILTTPGIAPSKARNLRFGRDGEDIKVITLTYNLDPRKDDEWLDRQRARRSEEDFAREIMINWEGSVEGRVYPEIMDAEVGDFPYDPAWGLYFSWDFGLDGTAITVAQLNPRNGKIRIIDAYENSNKPVHFYFPLVGKPIDSMFEYKSEDLDAIESFKKYKKAIHYGDPDVSKRAYQSKDVSSTRKILSEVGVYVQTKPEANKFHNRRERTKVWLQRGIEINKGIRTDQWLENIKYSRYPQRTETSQSTSEITLPIHDYTSHTRTTLEYLCVNLEAPKEFVPEKVDPQDKIRERVFGTKNGRNARIDDVLGSMY